MRVAKLKLENLEPQEGRKVEYGRVQQGEGNIFGGGVGGNFWLWGGKKIWLMGWQTILRGGKIWEGGG